MSHPSEIDEGKVALQVGGQKIAGTLLKPEAPVPGFLFIHGWGGDQAEDLGHAEELARLGCICFTFDLRGHADSGADKDAVTRQDSLDDVLAAYDYLVAQPMIDRSAIGVVGTSYGGYLAMLLTALRPVRWLAMRVPALYPDEHWEAACTKFRGDVLIVESEKDEQIPREALLSMQAAFRQANSLSHRIIHGATHAMRDPQHQRIYSTLLTGWIAEMVRASRLTYR
jgi:dienelactone hydrolase